MKSTYALFFTLLLTTPALAATPVSGTARAKDGDSMMVGSAEVRLFGVDAPEYGQTCMQGGATWACGSEAAGRLGRLVNGKAVTCSSMGTDQHGRVLGRCTIGPIDVNRMMVASGFAVAYRHYSSDYVAAENSAKVSKRGMWAGTFTMPSDYRHEGGPAPRVTVERRSQAPQRAQPRGSRGGSALTGRCVIKGNQGTNGWIYHVPGMPFYDQTRPEQFFCSEAAAQAAGYRRARVR